MICDICKKRVFGVTWQSDADGTVALCRECGQELQSTLDRVDVQLSRIGTMDNLLAEILAVAKKITRSDMGNIQLVDRDGVLRITVHDGFADEFLAFFSEVKESEAACGTALKTRQTIVVEDVERSPLFVGTPALKIMLNAGARAVQSTPIFSRSGELIGIFSTHYRQPRQIDTHTVRLLGFLAAQAGRYIERLTVAS